MAAKNGTKPTANEVEVATIGLDEGLRTLNEIAQKCGDGILDGAMLAVCVEHMTNSMIENVRTLYNIADREPSHGRNRTAKEKAHG